MNVSIAGVSLCWCVQVTPIGISRRRVDDEVGSNTVVYLDQATPQSDDLKSICRGKTVLNVLNVLRVY